MICDGDVLIPTRFGNEEAMGVDSGGVGESVVERGAVEVSPGPKAATGTASGRNSPFYDVTDPLVGHDIAGPARDRVCHAAVVARPTLAPGLDEEVLVFLHVAGLGPGFENVGYIFMEPTMKSSRLSDYIVD